MNINENFLEDFFLIWAQSFTSSKAYLHQDIKTDLVFGIELFLEGIALLRLFGKLIQ